MAKWLPPYGFTCKVHHMDAKVGGTYRMSFTNFTTGNGHSFGGEYQELVPSERIRYTDRFDDPNLSGEMQTRFEAPAPRNRRPAPLLASLAPPCDSLPSRGDLLISRRRPFADLS